MGREKPSNRLLDIPLANGHGRSHSRNLSAAAAPEALHLTTSPSSSREESTRVRLQKQRLREQHHAVVIGHRIPGYKTSAAFFASLRTNLRLNASPPPSPWSTPPSMRSSTGSLLPPPSPLSSPLSFVTESNMDETNSTVPEDPLAGVPELNTYLTTDEQEKVAALKLVADSVAQMRQAANTALIFHPLNMAVMMALLALVARYLVETQKRDVATVATTCTGMMMIFFVLCRFATQAYLRAAEAFNLEWLEGADVIVTKFDDEVIGTVIVEWIASDAQKKRKKVSKGEIKAWTVRMKYRGKDVGTALLEEVVTESKKKGADTVEFAEDHANALRVLPKFYNGKFDKQDKKGREQLQDLLESSPGRRKKKGGST